MAALFQVIDAAGRVADTNFAQFVGLTIANAQQVGEAFNLCFGRSGFAAKLGLFRALWLAFLVGALFHYWPPLVSFSNASAGQSKRPFGHLVGRRP